MTLTYFAKQASSSLPRADEFVAHSVKVCPALPSLPSPPSHHPPRACFCGHYDPHFDHREHIEIPTYACIHTRIYTHTHTFIYRYTDT